MPRSATLMPNATASPSTTQVAKAAGNRTFSMMAARLVTWVLLPLWSAAAPAIHSRLGRASICSSASSEAAKPASGAI